MNKKAIFIGCVVIAIVLVIALAAGSALFLYVRNNDNSNRDKEVVQDEDQDSNDNNDSEETPSEEEVPQSSDIQTVDTEFDGVSATLTRVYRSTSGLVVDIRLDCDEDYKDFTCNAIVAAPGKKDRYGEDSGKVRPSRYDVFESYIVDEDALKKYEVLKDANGKYLATEPFKEYTYLDRGESKNISITFTNPPATVKTISINVTGIEAFTAIELD